MGCIKFESVSELNWILSHFPKDTELKFEFGEGEKDRLMNVVKSLEQEKDEEHIEFVKILKKILGEKMLETSDSKMKFREEFRWVCQFDSDFGRRDAIPQWVVKNVQFDNDLIIEGIRPEWKTEKKYFEDFRDIQRIRVHILNSGGEIVEEHVIDIVGNYRFLPFTSLNYDSKELLSWRLIFPKESIFKHRIFDEDGSLWEIIDCEGIKKCSK